MEGLRQLEGCMEISAYNKSCPPRSDLQQLLQGHLSQWTSLKLRQHAEACADCQRLLALMRQETVPGPGTADNPHNTPANPRGTGAMPKLNLEASELENSNSEAPTTAFKLINGSNPEIQVDSLQPVINLSFLAPAQSEGELGRLGSYSVRKILGSGGMGIVFEAEDTLLKRQVALKVMKPELAANPVHRQRFLQEARSGASIPHDNIVTVYQVGLENGIPFLAMQYLQGESLAGRLQKQNKVAWPESLKIIREVVKGLGVAHESHLIHRDIKPDNIWLEVDYPGNLWKRVKILDFGLARSVTKADNHTGTGLIMGTPSYMSPEQARGLPLDGRCDLFSVGCVLYQMLTGVLPFRGENTLNILTSLALDEPTPVNMLDPSMPAEVSHLVKDLLAKKPSDRIPSAQALLERMDAIEKGMPIPASTIPVIAPGSNSIPPTKNLNPIGDHSPKPKAWYLNWKIGLVAAVLFINFVLLVFNFGNFGFLPTRLGGIAEGEPIRVGILQSLKGYMRPAGKGAKNATLLAIQEINDSGGVMEYSEKGVPISRRKIEPIEADPLSDSNSFSAMAQQLIVDQKVAVLFGCWKSSDRKNCLNILKENDHLLFYPVSYEGLEQEPNVIYLGAAPNQQLEFAISYLIKTAGKKKLYFVGEDGVYSKSALEIINQHIKALKEENSASAAEIAGTTLVIPPPNSPKFDEITKAIADAKPDLIVNTLSGDLNRDFFKELRAKGIRGKDIPTISFHITGELLQEIDSAGSLGDYVGWNYLPSIQNKDNEKFLERAKAKFGNDVIISDDMEASYSAVHLWAQGVRAAKSFKPSDIREKLKDISFAAPGGKIEIEQETQNAYKVPRFGKIIGPGQFEIVEGNDGKPARPIPFPRYKSPENWSKFLNDLQTQWNGNWHASQGK